MGKRRGQGGLAVVVVAAHHRRCGRFATHQIRQIRGQIRRCHRARIATPPPRLSDLASSPAVDCEKGVGGERLVAISNAIMGIRCHRSTTIIGIRCLRSQMRGKPVMRGPSTIAARREDEGDKSEVEEKLRSRGSAAATAEEEATSARWRKRSGVIQPVPWRVGGSSILAYNALANNSGE
uniref:Uncharacterized protein n=1 Tax=Oryza barthii TaxID=65489 RepID=A0A0D3GHZ6_9ORYZ